MEAIARKEIERRAKELGHTVSEHRGILRCYDSAGKVQAEFETAPPRLHFMGDTREDVSAMLAGCTVITCG